MSEGKTLSEILDFLKIKMFWRDIKRELLNSYFACFLFEVLAEMAHRRPKTVFIS